MTKTASASAPPATPRDRRRTTAQRRRGSPPSAPSAPVATRIHAHASSASQLPFPSLDDEYWDQSPASSLLRTTSKKKKTKKRSISADSDADARCEGCRTTLGDVYKFLVATAPGATGAGGE